MSDTHGSAQGAAEGGAQAGNPGGNAGAVQANQTGAEGASAQNNGAQSAAATEGTAAGQGQQTPWIDSVQNPELRAWAENKGLNNGNIENVLKSYHNLEKIFGADKAGNTVVLPGHDPKPEELDAFYTRLGRPVDPQGYGIKPPEGESDTFAKWAQNSFHELGLTEKQGQGLAAKWEEFRSGIINQQIEANRAKGAEAEAALRREWGAAYDRKVAGIERAAQALAITTEQLDGLRTAMGPVAAMKFVDGLNTKIGEHFTEEGAQPAGGLFTPQQAMQQLNSLSGDKAFTEALLNKHHPGHKDAVAKKAGLARMAAGEKP